MAKTVVIVGGLVRDPELKYIKTGTAVCEFSLGSKKVFTAEKGEKESDYWNCVVFGKQAENLAEYKKQGDMLEVSGYDELQQWEKDGKTQSKVVTKAERIGWLYSGKKGD